MSIPVRLTQTTVEDWAKSQAYHNNFLIKKDEALEEAVRNGQANGLPDIAVSASEGKFLYLTARSIAAKRVLEVGTLGGYSTIWLARALPADGKLVTLEISEKHAAIARDNIARAGLSDKVDVKVGPAADSLKDIEPVEPFDFVFIDADKPGNLTYYLEAKRLTRPGAVIIVDNVVRGGRVATEPEETASENVKGVRRLLEHLKGDKDVEATTLSTAGEKGYDGIVYSIKV